MSEFCTTEQALTIVKNHIEAQGFLALPHRRDGAAVVIPIGLKANKQQVATITIWPQISEKSPEEAEKEIGASVLDACRALVTEGATRANV